METRLKTDIRLLLEQYDVIFNQRSVSTVNVLFTLHDYLTIVYYESGLLVDDWSVVVTTGYGRIPHRHSVVATGPP